MPLGGEVVGYNGYICSAPATARAAPCRLHGVSPCRRRANTARDAESHDEFLSPTGTGSIACDAAGLCRV